MISEMCFYYFNIILTHLWVADRPHPDDGRSCINVQFFLRTAYSRNPKPNPHPNPQPNTNTNTNTKVNLTLTLNPIPNLFPNAGACRL